MQSKKAFVLALAFCLATPLTGFGQDRYSRVKIWGDKQSPLAQKEFIHGALQADHYHFEGDAYVIEIGEAERKKLEQSPYRYQVLVEDLAADFKRRNNIAKFYEADRQARLGFATPCGRLANIIPTPLAFTPGSMGGYYTYAEMVAKIGNLADTYGSIIDTFSIGRSVEGRPIWCVKISDNAATDENEAEVFFNGLQHAREAITGTSLIFFLQYLAENYAGNAKVQQLVNNRELFIVPCVNPDGYVHNQTIAPGGGGGWRKNRRPLGSGQFGVDLNRNYNADWGNCSAPIGGTVSSCGSAVATSANSTYWGTGPFSEPETRAIRDFTAARQFRVSIDQHSEGMYNTLPHGRVSLHPVHNLVDSQFLYGFASSAMATYNCHRLGNNLETLNYEVAGGNKDWMFQGDTSMQVNPRKVYSFTSEAGGGSFWPAASQIIPLAKGLVYQYLQAAQVAGAAADIHDASDVALASTSGTLSFSLRRVGVLDAPITVALIPLQNITAGSPLTFAAGTLPNYYNTTTGSISYSLPATLPGGQVVRFIWRVTADGISVDDTVTKLFNPVTVVYDDGETGAASANWTVSSGWGYSALGQGLNGSGRALTESPAGNYAANANRTATYTMPINLSDATAAYLSFWVRHRSENCEDILRVRLSTDGGASYTNLCGKLTIAEGNGTLAGQPALTGIREEWSRELFDLRNFVGPGMNNLRLQFQFLSNDDPPSGVDPYYKKVDDGFFLDNIRLVKTTATLITLPAGYLQLEGAPVTGGITLAWKTATEPAPAFFDIERSGDGHRFQSIGRVAGRPFRFVDTTVQPGTYYYRLREVDRNGESGYSNTVRLLYASSGLQLSVYPNPATDAVKLHWRSSEPGPLTLVLSDLAGRTLLRQTTGAGNRDASMVLSLQPFQGRVLLLTLRNQRNEVLATQKVIRHSHP